MEHLFHEHHSMPQTDQHCQTSQHIHKTTSLSLWKALYPVSLGYQNWCLLGFQAIWLVLHSFGGEIP